MKRSEWESESEGESESESEFERKIKFIVSKKYVAMPQTLGNMKNFNV
jgi:hypothetical protein